MLWSDRMRIQLIEKHLSHRRRIMNTHPTHTIKFVGTGKFLRSHLFCQIDHAAGIAPFVIVPTEDLDGFAHGHRHQ